MKVPRISGFEAMKAFARAGYVFHHQKGSHLVMYRGNSPLVVPNHKELATGMLRALIKDAGLTVEQFIALL